MRSRFTARPGQRCTSSGAPQKLPIRQRDPQPINKQSNIIHRQSILLAAQLGQSAGPSQQEGANTVSRYRPLSILASLALVSTASLAAVASPAPAPPSHTADNTWPAAPEELTPMANANNVKSLEQTFHEGDGMLAFKGETHYARVREGRLTHSFTRNGKVERKTFEGNNFVGEPSAFVWEDRQIHFTARTSGGTLEHFWTEPDGSLGQGPWVTSGVAHDPVTGVMSGQQHVFYVDDKAQLQHMWWEPHPVQATQVNNWTESAIPIDGSKKPITVTGRPSMIEWHGEHHVFVRTTDHRIGHFWWTPTDNAVRFDIWGDEKSATDVAAMATRKGKLLFYINEQGRLHRIGNIVDPGTGKHKVLPKEDWSADGVSETESAIMGRPQIYSTGDRHHVFAQRNDGSIRHYYKDPGGPVYHDTWAPAGTTIEPITGGILDGKETLFYTNMKGEHRHLWWDAETKQLHRNAFGDAGHNTKRPNLKMPSEPSIAEHQILEKDALFYSTVTSTGKGRVFYSNKLKSLPIHFTSVNSNERFGTSSGQRAIWEDTHDKVSIVGVNSKGTLLQTRQTSAENVQFERNWTSSLLNATGGVAVVEGRIAEKDQHLLAATVHDGIVVATSDGKKPLRWQYVLRHNNLEPYVSLEVGSGGAVHLFAQTTDGRIMVAPARSPENFSKNWSTLPELPNKRPITGHFSTAPSFTEAVLVAAADDQGKVFVFNDKEESWESVGTSATSGVPAIAESPITNEIIVASRDSEKRVLHSRKPIDGKFSEFEQMRAPGGPPVKMYSEVHLTTFQDHPTIDWMAVGYDADNTLFSAFRPFEDGAQQIGAIAPTRKDHFTVTTID